MNKLSLERRTQVVKALCEGNSIRSTSRMTGIAINTVVKLLIELGAACLDYQDSAMRNLPCQRLQCDEIWSFVYSKAKNVPEEHKDKFGFGDVWTWTAIDAQTKLVPCWRVGKRDGAESYCQMWCMRGQAAIPTDVSLTVPSWKWTPSMSLPSWFTPLIRFHRRSAHIPSL